MAQSERMYILYCNSLSMLRQLIHLLRSPKSTSVQFHNDSIDQLLCTNNIVQWEKALTHSSCPMSTYNPNFQPQLGTSTFLSSSIVSSHLPQSVSVAYQKTTWIVSRLSWCAEEVSNELLTLLLGARNYTPHHIHLLNNKRTRKVVRI